MHERIIIFPLSGVWFHLQIVPYDDILFQIEHYQILKPKTSQYEGDYLHYQALIGLRKPLETTKKG